MKTVLFLGAAPTQVAPIVYAVEQGYYVITCDNRPDNPGHQLAHEAHNISTTDKKAVLELADSKQIGGIVAYASDPAAPTAAYVAERLGLPGNPYESVVILSQKDRFRKFLQENGFNTPRSNSFYEEAQARKWLLQIKLPAYVKPIDSSGGKGITVLDNYEGFSEAFAHAKKFSLEKKVVVEEKISSKVGYQNDSDVFMVNGKLRFWIWGDSHFDCACAPPFQMASSFPGTLSGVLSDKAAKEIEKILTLLGCRSGAFNVEFLVDDRDEIWFLEIGARNGGGGTVDAIKLVTGVDLAKYTVDAALGDECRSLSNKAATGFAAEYLMHSLDTGVMEDIIISDELSSKIFEKNVWARPGDYIYKAAGSNHALGTMIFRFDSAEEMHRIINDINDHIKVKIEEEPVEVSGVPSLKVS